LALAGNELQSRKRASTNGLDSERQKAKCQKNEGNVETNIEAIEKGEIKAAGQDVDDGLEADSDTAEQGLGRGRFAKQEPRPWV
jgi:hypothetical protein